MREESPAWKHGVVLVCANERGPESTKPSCGRIPAEELKGWLKAKTRADGGPPSEMRVLTSSCLSLCPEQGIAVSLMPGNRLLQVDPEADRQALLDLVCGHAHDHASKDSSRRSRARSMLSKLRS